MTEKTQKHSPLPFKLWHSGYANTPFILYSGNNSPALNREGYVKMNGSIRVAEIPSNNMALDDKDNIIQDKDEEFVQIACNSFYQMKEALEVIISATESAGIIRVRDNEPMMQAFFTRSELKAAKKALKLAEGK